MGSERWSHGAAFTGLTGVLMLTEQSLWSHVRQFLLPTTFRLMKTFLTESKLDLCDLIILWENLVVICDYFLNP